MRGGKKGTCSNSNISDSLINCHDDVGDDVGDVDDAVMTLAGAGCINMRTKRLATCLHVHAGDHDDNHDYEYVHDETMMAKMMVKV